MGTRQKRRRGLHQWSYHQCSKEPFQEHNHQDGQKYPQGLVFETFPARHYLQEGISPSFYWSGFLFCSHVLRSFCWLPWRAGVGESQIRIFISCFSRNFGYQYVKAIQSSVRWNLPRMDWRMPNLSRTNQPSPSNRSVLHARQRLQNPRVNRAQDQFRNEQRERLQRSPQLPPIRWRNCNRNDVRQDGDQRHDVRREGVQLLR